VTLITVSANGCPDTTVQSVYIYPQPIPSFADTGFCLNDGTNFTDLSTVDTGSVVNWAWSFGDASSSTIQDPFHQYSTAGNYTVSLIVTTNYGCTDTISNGVTIFPSPFASFLTDPTSAANTLQPVTFTDQSQTNIIGWWWDFGDNSANDTTQNTVHSYALSGTYTITLAVVDANGCTDTTSYDYIISTPPDVPSGFSPNGDGHNDLLFVYGGPFDKIDFRIYNEWGELIWVSNDASYCSGHTCIGWDGKRDNVDQPIGVYVYTVSATTPDGVSHELSGNVTLLR
jgi:gliding motility-associated-like protein